MPYLSPTSHNYCNFSLRFILTFLPHGTAIFWKLLFFNLVGVLYQITFRIKSPSSPLHTIVCVLFTVCFCLISASRGQLTRRPYGHFRCLLVWFLCFHSFHPFCACLVIFKMCWGVSAEPFRIKVDWLIDWLPSYPLLRLLWSKSDNEVTRKRILDQYHTSTPLSSTALR